MIEVGICININKMVFLVHIETEWLFTVLADSILPKMDILQRNWVMKL